MARLQERGRGSHGRQWVSIPGNLFLSVLLRPNGRARDGGLWSLLAGVAAAEAVEGLLPDRATLTLKWPNDLLLSGRKLAGILIDSAADSAGALEWLVIGVGMNLAAAPDVPGRETACLATVAAPENVAELVLARLAHWRALQAEQGFAPVREAWLARAAPVGAPMIFTERSAECVRGSFAGLAEDGSLRLRTGGLLREFAVGEVSLRAED